MFTVRYIQGTTAIRLKDNLPTLNAAKRYARKMRNRCAWICDDTPMAIYHPQSSEFDAILYQRRRGEQWHTKLSTSNGR